MDRFPNYCELCFIREFAGISLDLDSFRDKMDLVQTFPLICSRNFMTERKSILLVDDDEDIQEILQDLLSDEYHILLAGNGREAWEMIQENSPDLMITDLKMPHMDGRELVKKVRDEGYSFPVVVISGASFDPEYLKESGINHVLTKPFNQFDLDEICKRFLDS